MIRENLLKRFLIDPTKTISYEDHMICPHCKTQHKIIEHGEKRVCGCGLTMTAYGNSLECVLNKIKMRFNKLKRIVGQ